MGAIHILVILILVGLGVAGLRSRPKVDGDEGDFPFTYRPKFAAFVVGAVVYIMVIPPAVGQIEAGHRGVVLEFGNPTGVIKGEGLYFVTPFVNSVVVMDVQTQIYPVAKAESASHDLQTVHTDVVINYHLDATRVVEIYRQYRQDIASRVMAPAVQEVIKAATAKYTAEQLIQQRPLVKSDIDKGLESRLEPLGLIIEAVNITNFDFAKEFTDTIEKQAVAQRQVEVEKNKLEQIKITAQVQVTQAEAAAQAAIAQAKGQAEATRLNAEANALAIRLRADALASNQKLVELEYAVAAQKWDGKMPTYNIGGGGAIPFLNLPAPVGAAAAASR